MNMDYEQYNFPSSLIAIFIFYMVIRILIYVKVLWSISLKKYYISEDKLEDSVKISFIDYIDILESLGLSLARNNILLLLPIERNITKPLVQIVSLEDLNISIYEFEHFFSDFPDFKTCFSDTYKKNTKINPLYCEVLFYSTYNIFKDRMLAIYSKKAILTPTFFGVPGVLTSILVNNFLKVFRTDDRKCLKISYLLLSAHFRSSIDGKINFSDYSYNSIWGSLCNNKDFASLILQTKDKLLSDEDVKILSDNIKSFFTNNHLK